ncbi:MAG TPA: GAF and ANTAR domain-containing protein [Actinocrinis sp.]|uniref:GAF and ANTAR domain-containing protein n=1 Tax=Actinocrinis sp. TaxID=1920516 RepID=UPI002D396ACD|nr:GAF and ANTAR domain-containing protein [Actinocrinis sp.]HZU55994.1 GAF and ANTAR domain-containing protein [Actinocrinis sp.]
MAGSTQAVHELIVTLADSVGADSRQQNLPQILADGVAGLVKTDTAVLLDEAGSLTVAAAHGSEAADLAATEVDSGQGPSVDCFRDGVPLAWTDLRDRTPSWPLWGGQARGAGFTAAYVRPLRRRQYRVGVLTLLASEATPHLNHRQLATVQALADAATVGLLHQRLLRRQALVTAQLRFALDSRILIEQAKGVLSERAGTTVDQAFQLLREYARSHGRKIHEVAADVISENLRLPAQTADRPQPPAK